MNFTKSFTKIESNACVRATLPIWKPGTHLNADVYAVIVFTTTVTLMALPFTLLLNALVIAAVKTTRQLKTKADVLLACLAATDFMVGLTVQPLFITMAISILEGMILNDFCILENTSGNMTQFLCIVSLFHLMLISLERYLAIQHPFFHGNHVTKTRLIIAASLAWLMVLISKLLGFVGKGVKYVVDKIDFAFIIISVPVIVCFHVFVYLVVRRHEKQIISQQVSLEAKEKLCKEKKALKTTTIIILAVLLSYFPSMIFMITNLLEKTAFNVRYTIFFLAITITILNSLMNPLIYAARNRKFRVAFVQLLFRRRLQQQAEDVDMRGFRCD